MAIVPSSKFSYIHILRKRRCLQLGKVYVGLYEYLSTSCHSIERLIDDIQLGRPLLHSRVFSWNKIPGEGDKMLLSHLKQIFNLESVDPYDIKKEATSITVNTSSGTILIKLDKSTSISHVDSRRSIQRTAI